MSGSWKERERLVASWFQSRRNPLSGRNNVADDGTTRVGDIVYSKALVEVKRRKRVASISRAKDTRTLANTRALPWAHLEFETGTPSLVAWVVDFETAEKIARFLKGEWDNGRT